MQLPAECDGCGAQFTVNHALDCRRGGLIIQRHNEVRDTLCDLASLTWKQVIKEPAIRDASDGNLLKADIAIRGVWHPQAMASFDVRIVDTDAKSYVIISPQSVLATAEREKIVKYSAACVEKHMSFTPICIFVDGLLGPHTVSFMKRLADHNVDDTQKPYSRELNLGLLSSYVARFRI